jgi:hypothetical protein
MDKKRWKPILRKKLGLDSDCPPTPQYIHTHGGSVALPPSGKIYEVESVDGRRFFVSKRGISTRNNNSNYFEGQRHEDADFASIAKTGKHI